MALLRKEPKSEPTEKWEAQLRKGCLELAILACLWDQRLYGLEILRGLEQNSNLVLAEGTVYPILARLKEDGLLQSEWVEADAGHPAKVLLANRSRDGKKWFPWRSSGTALPQT